MNTFLEIIYLLFFLLYCYLESLYRLFVPVKRKSVKGKIILVTGAGHGIGKEFALEFGRLRGILVLWDINKANNDATADAIREEGGTAHTYVCDVSKLEDIKRVADQVYRDVGNVDILVNNAGILLGGELLKIKDEDIRRTFDINTMAHFWTLREFLPSMLERNEGHIINVASMAGKSGTAYLVDYSASKFAVVGMTEALSDELRQLGKDGIKTTTICPMFVDTGLTKYPQGRFGKILSPKVVAMEAIDGALKNQVVVMVPRSIQISVAIGHLFPYRFRRALREFMGYGIRPQYESSKPESRRR